MPEPHRAYVAVDSHRQQDITTLQWTAKFPDLSPIEHLWDVLGIRARARCLAPANLQEHNVALQEEWQQILRAAIRRAIFSMSDRCRACVAAGGGHTRYCLNFIYFMYFK